MRPSGIVEDSTSLQSNSNPRTFPHCLSVLITYPSRTSYNTLSIHRLVHVRTQIEHITSMVSYTSFNLSMDCAFSSFKISPSGNRGVSTSVGTAYLYHFPSHRSCNIPSIPRCADIVWSTNDDCFAAFGGLGASDSLDVYESTDNHVAYKRRHHFDGRFTFAIFLDSDTILAIPWGATELRFLSLGEESTTVQELSSAWATDDQMAQVTFSTNLLALWSQEKLEIWKVARHSLPALVEARSFDHPVSDLKTTQAGAVAVVDVFGQIKIFEERAKKWTCEAFLEDPLWRESKNEFEKSRTRDRWFHAWPQLRLVKIAESKPGYEITVSASKPEWEADSFTMAAIVSDGQVLKQDRIDARVFLDSEDAHVLQTAAAIYIRHLKTHWMLKYQRNCHYNVLAYSADLRYIFAWDPTCTGTLSGWERRDGE